MNTGHFYRGGENQLKEHVLLESIGVYWSLLAVILRSWATNEVRRSGRGSGCGVAVSPFIRCAAEGLSA